MKDQPNLGVLSSPASSLPHLHPHFSPPGTYLPVFRMHDAAPFRSGMPVPHPSNPTPHLRSFLLIHRSKGHVCKLSPVPLLHTSCYKASFPSSPFSVYTLTCVITEYLSPPVSCRLHEDRNPLLVLLITAGTEGVLHRYLLDQRRLLEKERKKDDTLKHLQSQ